MWDAQSVWGLYSLDHRVLPPTYKKNLTIVLYPKCGGYFTKARQGLEKCLEVPPMPDGVSWELSQFDYEGAMNDCVEGPTVLGLVNTTDE